MISVFNGGTADAVWQAALTHLGAGDLARAQTSRGGQTMEVLHAALSIEDPRQRWVVSRRPAMNPAFAIVELFWILSGRNDAAFLNAWNSQLPKYAGRGERYHGAYGYRLRHHFGMDQLERAYQALRQNPDGRQVVLQIWDAFSDFPDERGEPRDADIPCNIGSFLKIRDGKLEWMQMIRSNDLFRGVPYNFIQFTTLQEVMAGWLGVELGTYNQLSDSLHMYAYDQPAVHAFPVKIAPNTDFLCTPKQESEAIFRQMCHTVDTVSAPNCTQHDLQMALDCTTAPPAFHNLLCVVLAEAARRRGWLDLSQRVMEKCVNPVLVQVWEAWFDRWQHKSR